MDSIIINPEKFTFKELPAYAEFILKERMHEYVNHLIRFSREENLPLLKSLSKFSDDELVALSLESHGEILTALAGNTIHAHIRENVQKWVSNKLLVIDKDEIVAEDLTMSAFLKRKALSCFLSDYTEDKELKKVILSEIDVYTTQEELVSYSTYLKLQQDKINLTNDKLAFQESLLLEAQEISELGSYYIDYVNPKNSLSTPQITKITGVLTENESFFDNVHIDDVEVIQKVWESTLAEGGTFDFTYRYVKEETEKRLHAKGIINSANGKPLNIRGTVRDITKEYNLIQRLTESEALQKQAQQLTHIGNWSWDIPANSIRWSDEMYRIYGLDPQSEEITFERFVSMIHPDDRAAHIAAIEKSLTTGIAKDYTLRIVNSNGKVKILKGHGSIQKDKNDKPIKLVGTCQDITKSYYLNRELVALNKSLHQKNNELMNMNRELESFNYIASHDLQEPLRKIQLFTARFVEQAGSVPEAARQSVEKVISAAARMQQLIADLIEFSQVSSPSEAFETVSLNKMINEIKSSFGDAGETGRVNIQVDDLPNVNVIPFQFSQLLTNIIGNALKYKHEARESQVSITSKIIHDKKHDENPPSDGSFLKISIADNGIGFEPEQKEKIFDLFKRLHSGGQYSGTGIGLAICKKIMHNHNGFIKAESEKGKGSVFHIYLPSERLTDESQAVEINP